MFEYVGQWILFHVNEAIATFRIDWCEQILLVFSASEMYMCLC